MEHSTRKPRSTTLSYWQLYDDHELWDYFPVEDDFIIFKNFEEASKYRFIFDILDQIYIYAAFVSLIVNIPHLIILTRKELRSNLIYIVMTGICICDLLHATGKVALISMNWNIWYKIEFCGGKPYFHLMTEMLSYTFQIITRRCSGLLALFIAGFRSFSVIFPMSNAVNFMMKPKSGYLIASFFILVCTGWGAVYFFQISVFLHRCEGGEMPKKYVPFGMLYDEKWEIRYRMIDAFISFVVCVAYGIVAMALIIALCLAQKRRKNLKSETKNHTSLLVFLMALTLFASEAVYGAIFVLSSFVFNDYFEQSYLMDLDSVALTLLIVNSVTHCIICFCMSSQYRDTVKGIICCGRRKNKEMKAVKVESSAHPTTANTPKASDGSNKTF